MEFNNANAYTLTGSPITMQVTTGSADITLTSGAHTISAPLVLASDTTVTGPGTLTASTVRGAGLTVNTNVTLAPSVTTPSVSKLTSLAIAGDATAPTAKLDLTNNALIVDYTGSTPYATIRDYVKSARSGGTLDRQRPDLLDGLGQPRPRHRGGGQRQLLHPSHHLHGRERGRQQHPGALHLGGRQQHGRQG